MKRLSWDDVLEKVKNDGEINFVSEVITPLHALGIETFLVHQKNRGIRIKGFILVVPHPQTGLALTEDMFHVTCYEGITVAELELNTITDSIDYNFYLRLSSIRHEAATFYYASPYAPSFSRIPQVMSLRPNDVLKVVITEEGIGSYVSNPYKLEKYKRAKMSTKDCLLFLLQIGLRNRYFEYKLRRTGKLEKFLMYRKEGKKLQPNIEYISSVNEIFSAEPVEGDYSLYEEAVVFVPGLLYDAGMISNRCDVEIYEKIKGIIGTDTKYIVKPHPREKSLKAYERLNCEVERNNQYSCERIISHLRRKPRYVIGDCSTTLANVAAIFDVKAIAVNKLIDKAMLFDKDMFKVYNMCFDKVVYIPNNWDELRAYLKKK